MSTFPDALDAAGAASPEPVLCCPVCRWQQSPAATACERCHSDVGLLAGVLREAQARRTALAAALARGDSGEALAHIEWLCALTGPSGELAMLRGLLRTGRRVAELPDTPLWTDPLGGLPPLTEEPPA